MSDRVRRRLRAPSEDGAALIDPPLAQIPDVLATNCHLVSGYRYDCQGLSLQKLIVVGREALLTGSLAYTREYRDTSFVRVVPPAVPFVLCGHQPALFHPGVWFKNFLLSAVAQRLNAVPFNLIVDTDDVRSTSIRVPLAPRSPAAIETIPYDAANEPVPFEERPIRDKWLFESFHRRVLAAYSTFCKDDQHNAPLLEGLWNGVLAAAARKQKAANLGRVLAEGRHTIEALLGVKTLEYPLSGIAQSTAFRWFAVHLLAHSRRLAAIYNTALSEYRQLNGVRSHAHPVPPLGQADDWYEAPFLIWTKENPRRRHAFVRQQQDSLIVTDREGLRIVLDVLEGGTAEKAIEQLAAAESRGIKLRPRALITTMYARLVLSDLFIHGIGGAKYDELTDLIIRRFFGVEPPGYVTATATFRLPIDRPQVTVDDVRRGARRIRDVRYRPESFVSDPLVLQDTALAKQLQAFAAEKRDYLATHDLRQCSPVVFEKLDRLNRAMHDLLAPIQQQLRADHAALVEQWKQSQALSSREFSFCLFPLEILPARLLDLCKLSS